MMPTPHSADNQKFSNQAHQTARSVIYPALFKNLSNGDELEFENTTIQDGERGSVLDGEMATDRIVLIRSRLFATQPKSYRHLEPPGRRIAFTVQERFREPEFLPHQDLTITVWNPNSNQPSELFKLMAQWFLYGYYDKNTNTHLHAVLVNINDMMMGIVNGYLPFKDGMNPRTKQPFIAIKFNDLRTHNIMRAEWRNNCLEWCFFKKAAIPFVQKVA